MRPTSFLVGSAFSAPLSSDAPGVPLTAGIVGLVREEFEVEELRLFDEATKASGAQNYQAAFQFLQGRRAPGVANDIIRKAVWKARKPVTTVDGAAVYSPSTNTSDETFRIADKDIEGWYLSPAHAGLGQLATAHPEIFGHSILTTNFDPLVEVSIAKAGGSHFRTVVHREGNLGQTEGTGTHVIHLHGYWYGSDTLHTPRQIGQQRPRLKASLSHLIAGHTVVVMGYGGWDDIFTRTLMDVTLDDRSSPEVIWTCRDRKSIHPKLLEILSPGLDRGRVSLYDGVDCNTFLPKLSIAWSAERVPAQINLPKALPIRAVKQDAAKRKITFRRGEQDHPPKIDFYVGRSGDLNDITTGEERVVYLTGIGGQGKSALAAKYFENSQLSKLYDYYVWRDCKEESDRFENQLASIVVALSDGQVLMHELAGQPIEVILDAFLSASKDTKLLLIFDNIDHYVDFNSERLTGAAGRFVDKFLAAKTQSRVLFTCRPIIVDHDASAKSIRLEGIQPTDAEALFRLRGAAAPLASIHEAHRLTRGHAFWLDLLAAQLARRSPDVQLDDLLENFHSDTPELPTATLRSIWGTLNDREQHALQALAETVRPTTALRLSQYLIDTTNYNKLHKALRTLKAANLLVTKKQDDGQEVIELHPLVRTFVRSNFPKPERDRFIHAILSFYKALFGAQRAKDATISVSSAGQWIEGAELHIAAGEYIDALECLHDVSGIVQRYSSPREYLRVCRMLLSQADWAKLAESKYLDSVVTEYVEINALAGELGDCAEALERYLETIDGKSAKYINYCNLMCYTYWANGDFPLAIRWGAEGVDIKRKSGIDTSFDAEHNYALAQRDSGDIDPALEFFLKGHSLESVLSGKPGSTKYEGGYYGNIGRCLQLMGQFEPSLACYHHAIKLTDCSGSTETIQNRAYIRQWIGESLLGQGDMEQGTNFLKGSASLWEIASPQKLEKIKRVVSSVGTTQLYETLSTDAAERTIRAWANSAH